MKRKTKSLARNHTGPQIHAGPKKVGPAGPPRNSVTMIADIVIVFMNSARKKRAKRIELYSVWKPPTSSCSASTRSNGGRLSSAVPAIRKITNGTTPVTIRFQRGIRPPAPVAGLRHHDVVGRQRAGQQHHGHHGEAEGRFVGHHLRRRPHRAEQRVLRAGRPAGQHHAVDGDRGAGEDEQDADGRVGQLQVGVVTEDLDGALLLVGELAADRDHREHEEGGHQRQERREDEDPLVGAVGQQVLLEEELDAVGQRLEDAERPGPVGADPVRHVGVHLALEPDHEHHRHEQQREGDHDLEEDDQHLFEADVAREERIEPEDRRHDHGFTTRISVTRRGGVDEGAHGGPRLVEGDHGRARARCGRRAARAATRTPWTRWR